MLLLVVVLLLKDNIYIHTNIYIYLYIYINPAGKTEFCSQEILFEGARIPSMMVTERCEDQQGKGRRRH